MKSTALLLSSALLALLVGVATSIPIDDEVDNVPSSSQVGPRPRSLTAEEVREAESAKYHYASDIQDGIADLTQQREEVRDGRKVTGFYSYSDGHYRRKISYVADENGYRVVGEEVTPLEGPQVNPEGVAEIHTLAHGNEVLYSVKGDDKTRHKLKAAALASVA